MVGQRPKTSETEASQRPATRSQIRKKVLYDAPRSEGPTTRLRAASRPIETGSTAVVIQTRAQAAKKEITRCSTNHGLKALPTNVKRVVSAKSSREGSNAACTAKPSHAHVAQNGLNDCKMVYNTRRLAHTRRTMPVAFGMDMGDRENLAHETATRVQFEAGAKRQLTRSGDDQIKPTVLNGSRKIMARRAPLRKRPRTGHQTEGNIELQKHATLLSQDSGPIGPGGAAQSKTRQTQQGSNPLLQPHGEDMAADVLSSLHTIASLRGRHPFERSLLYKRAMLRVPKIVVDESNLLGVHRFGGSDIMEVGSGVLYTMRKREQHHLPSPWYLSQQDQMTRDRRATLFDWMFEVGQEFKLSRATLHSAINFVDRYMTIVPNVAKTNLQLVGVTSLWVASKNKEIQAPPAVHFAHSTNNTYNVKQIMRMELELLSKFDWVLDPITCFAWVDLYVHLLFNGNGEGPSGGEENDGMADFDGKSQTTNEGSPDQGQFHAFRKPWSRSDHNPDGSYAQAKRSSQGSHTWLRPTNDATLAIVNRVMEVIDVAMLDINALFFLPSTIAAAALTHILCKENRILEHPVVEHVTKYSKAELEECTAWMASFALKLPPQLSEPHPKMREIVQKFPRQDWHTFQRHHKMALKHFRKHAPHTPLYTEEYPSSLVKSSEVDADLNLDCETNGEVSKAAQGNHTEEYDDTVNLVSTETLV